jgi:rhodanese-related sulfurtransferase
LTIGISFFGVLLQRTHRRSLEAVVTGGNRLDARTAHGSLEEARVVDVRESYEFKGGHIDGSTNIPLGALPARIDEFEGAGRVLTVCTSGARSDEAARYLKAFGVDAENLDGGVIAWKQAGFDLVTPDGEPGRVVM